MVTGANQPTVWQPDVPTITKGPCVHYCGGVYDVMGVAHDSTNATDGRWMVLYRSRESGVLCAREIGEFTDVVEVDGVSVPRFAPCAEDGSSPSILFERSVREAVNDTYQRGAVDALLAAVARVKALDDHATRETCEDVIRATPLPVLSR